MNKLILAVMSIFLCSAAYAGPKKSMADLDKELKQAKSTDTVRALVESIAETTPETAEDVVVLGRLMDRHPVQGQKAAMLIKNPALANAVMKECDRQAAKTKAVRARGIVGLTEIDRQEYLSGYMNGTVLIATLGKLKDKNAIPMLRGYLGDEDFSTAASIALGQLGDVKSMEAMLKGIGTGAPIDLSGYGDKGLVRVVEELARPGVATSRKNALVEQIKGSPSPERKRMLKDLALNHKDSGVRDRAALALLNSLMVNKEPGDQAFISEWVGKNKNNETGYWAVTSIRVSHGTSDKPLEPEMVVLLIDVLMTSTRASTRQEAAQTLAIFKAKEALPYFEECAERDTNSTVRGECQYGYWGIAGKIPSKFHPADVASLTEYYKRPHVIEAFGKKSESNPKDRFGLALRHAVEKYVRNHSK